MKTKWLILLTVIASACSNSKQQAKEELLKGIAANEQILLNDTTGLVNITAANEALKFYSMYIHQYPTDSIVPEYMFRKANLFNALNKPKEAIATLETIVKDYKSYPKRDVCIFMLGDIYETKLNDIDKARYYYEWYLKEYPNTQLAKDIQVLLQYLGQSPEEIFQQIQKNDTIKA